MKMIVVTNPFDPIVNFESNKVYFWRLNVLVNVLVFHFGANQCCEITGIFFKDFEPKWAL